MKIRTFLQSFWRFFPSLRREFRELVDSSKAIKESMSIIGIANSLFAMRFCEQTASVDKLLSFINSEQFERLKTWSDVEKNLLATRNETYRDLLKRWDVSNESQERLMNKFVQESQKLEQENHSLKAKISTLSKKLSELEDKLDLRNSEDEQKKRIMASLPKSTTQIRASKKHGKQK